MTERFISTSEKENSQQFTSEGSEKSIVAFQETEASSIQPTITTSIPDGFPAKTQGRILEVVPKAIQEYKEDDQEAENVIFVAPDDKTTLVPERSDHDNDKQETAYNSERISKTNSDVEKPHSGGMKLLSSWEDIEEAFVEAHGRKPRPHLESLWNQLQTEAQSLFTGARPKAIIPTKTIIPRPIAQDDNKDDQALVEAKKRTAIADLIEDIRRKQKPATDQESLLSFYNRGLISKRELTRLSVGLSEFFRGHDLHISYPYYHAIHACFADIGGVFTRKTIRADGQLYRRDQFRVDPEIMEKHLPDLKEFNDRIIQINYPPRTEEEKQYYQGKLLRVPNEAGIYETISLDYALEELTRRADRQFSMKGFRLEHEDLAMEALIKSLPYLRGERRDFDDFRFFLGYFYIIIDNMCIDIWKGKKLKTVSFDAMQEMTGEEVIPESNVDSNVGRKIDSNFVKEALQKLSSLSPEETNLLQLRSEGLSYAIITRFFRGKSENTLRTRMHRLLNRLHPERQKSPRSKNPKKYVANNTLVQEYKAFRDSFLKDTGRIPTSTDITKANKERKIDHSAMTLSNRFGNGSWTTTQATLEKLITQETP